MCGCTLPSVQVPELSLQKSLCIYLRCLVENRKQNAEKKHAEHEAECVSFCFLWVVWICESLSESFDWVSDLSVCPCVFKCLGMSLNILTALIFILHLIFVEAVKKIPHRPVTLNHYCLSSFTQSQVCEQKTVSKNWLEKKTGGSSSFSFLSSFLLFLFIFPHFFFLYHQFSFLFSLVSSCGTSLPFACFYFFLNHFYVFTLLFISLFFLSFSF